MERQADSPMSIEGVTTSSFDAGKFSISGNVVINAPHPVSGKRLYVRLLRKTPTAEIEVSKQTLKESFWTLFNYSFINYQWKPGKDYHYNFSFQLRASDILDKPGQWLVEAWIETKQSSDLKLKTRDPIEVLPEVPAELALFGDEFDLPHYERLAREWQDREAFSTNPIQLAYILPIIAFALGPVFLIIAGVIFAIAVKTSLILQLFLLACVCAVAYLIARVFVKRYVGTPDIWLEPEALTVGQTSKCRLLINPTRNIDIQSVKVKLRAVKVTLRAYHVDDGSQGYSEKRYKNVFKKISTKTFSKIVGAAFNPNGHGQIEIPIEVPDSALPTRMENSTTLFWSMKIIIRFWKIFSWSTARSVLIYPK